MQDNIAQIDDYGDYGNVDIAPTAAQGVNVQGIAGNTEFYINRKGEKIPIAKIRREELAVQRQERKAEARRLKLIAAESKKERKYKYTLNKETNDEIDKTCTRAFVMQGKKAKTKTKALIDTENRFNKKSFEVYTNGYGVRNQKFQIYGCTFAVRGYNKNPRIDEIAYFLLKALELLEPERRKFKSRVHIILNGEYGYSTKAVLLSKVDFKYLYCLLKRKEKYRSIEVNQLTLELIEYTLPGGAGQFVEELKKVLSKPKCVTAVETDSFCGTYALVIGMAESECARKNLLKPTRRKKLDSEAKALAAKIGVDTVMSVDDFDKFCNMYPRYAVRIIDHELNFLYKSIKQLDYSEVKTIYILLFKDHYFYVNNIDGLFNPSKVGKNNKFCEGCDENVSKYKFAAHKCKRPKCRYCTKLFDNEYELHKHYNYGTVTNVHHRCENCNSKFYNIECYNYHATCCKGGHYCESCHTRSARSGAEHRCGEKYCTNCKIWYVDANIGVNNIISHRCYMQKTVPKDYETEYYAYDVESTLTKVPINDTDPSAAGSIALAGAESKLVHKISIICAVKLKTRERFVWTVAEFIEFLAKQKRAITMFAHNAKSYDNYLMLGLVLKNAMITIGKVIEEGRKVLSMKIGVVTMVDSMNHFGGSLESLIQTFGLKQKLIDAGFTTAKGFFPYTFYSEENKDYEGTLPPREYFEKYEGKKGEEFDAWYLSASEYYSDGSYCIQDECIKYCIQDCAILALALEVYRENGIAINGIDPLKSVTIAGYTMKVFRTNHLREGTIVKPTLEEYEFAKKAMQGGRTNAFVLHSKVPKPDLEQERIDYADVVSMYPWVLATQPMPVGAATVQEYSAESPKINAAIINSSFGIVECDVECPRTLLIPVLLRKDEEKGKLVDSLEPLIHCNYTTVELQLAIKCGYTITRIHKIHHYAASTVLFKNYIDKYIKIKQDADKQSSECKESGDTAGYESAQGLRAIAKSMLNNLWGKFGQNDDMTFTEYYQNPIDWFRLVALERKGLVEIKHATVVDEIMYCKYKDINKKNVKLNNTNMAIAAFTTSHARVRLYRAMQQIGVNSGRIIYCDTDSVIYKWTSTGPNLKYGTELGDFKLETKSPIVEFAALGPKTYAYVTADESSVVKSKGFSVDRFRLKEHEELVNRVINLETYLWLLNGGLGAALAYEYNAFVRKNREISSELSEKILKFEFDKRIIIDTGRTVPFGFVEV